MQSQDAISNVIENAGSVESEGMPSGQLICILYAAEAPNGPKRPDACCNFW